MLTLITTPGFLLHGIICTWDFLDTWTFTPFGYSLDGQTFYIGFFLFMDLACQPAFSKAEQRKIYTFWEFDTQNADPKQRDYDS